MVDWDDSSDFFLMSLFTSGWGGLILLLIGIGFMVVASLNDDECSKKACPAPMTPHLMNHMCQCTVEAK